MSKKYRYEAYIKFESEGTVIQFSFNESIMDSLKNLISFASPLFFYITGDLLGKLNKRNKLIRISDNYSGGLVTVKEYKSNDIADNDMKTRKGFVRQKQGP